MKKNLDCIPDPLDLGIPNICYSHAKTLPITDRRHKRFQRQRKTRGFDDTEIWSLDYTIAQFILPRLKEFRSWNCGYPSWATQEEWNKIVDDMIFFFEFASNESLMELPKKDMIRVKRGKKLFADHFFSLWT